MMPMLALELDGDGKAHVAAGVDGAGIVYLTNSGGTWVRQQVTQAPARGFDSQPSLAFDTDGALHLAFTRWSRYEPCPFGCPGGPRIVLDGIYHASLSDGTWTAERALLPNFHSASLAVRGGLLYLAAAAETAAGQSSVVFAKGTSGGDLTLDAVSAAGSAPVLVLAADGVVHIAFHGGLNDAFVISVASATGDGTFSIEPVARPAWVFLPPALAIAPNGRLNLAWSTDVGIQLSVHGTAGWGAPMTVAGRGVELGGMAVGPSGDVHVVTLPQFFSAPGLGRGVWHFTDRTGQFEGERLGRGPDAETEGARFPSAIAVDADGRPHIVYTWMGEPPGLYYAVGP